MSKVREGIARRSFYDKVNISDDVRDNSPLAKKLYAKEVEAYRSIIRTDEDTILETDINVAALAQIGNLVITAVENGAAGNLISIEILDGATAGSETVFVEDRNIVIGIEEGISDYDAIIAAIVASDEASALITPSLDGLGSDVAIVSDIVYLMDGK